MHSSSKREMSGSTTVVFIESGRNLVIPVYGEHYAQSKKQSLLAKMYKENGDKNIELSLTPPCDYQIERNWPEPPFLNVNPLGSVETTKDNWIGYIHPFEPEEKDESRLERQKYIKKLIKIGEVCPVVINGKVIKEGSEYSLLLFASRKSIDKSLRENSDAIKAKKEQTAKISQQKPTNKRQLIIRLLGVTGIVLVVSILLNQVVPFALALVVFSVLLLMLHKR